MAAARHAQQCLQASPYCCCCCRWLYRSASGRPAPAVYALLSCASLCLVCCVNFSLTESLVRMNHQLIAFLYLYLIPRHGRAATTTAAATAVLSVLVYTTTKQQHYYRKCLEVSILQTFPSSHQTHSSASKPVTQRTTDLTRSTSELVHTEMTMVNLGSSPP